MKLKILLNLGRGYPDYREGQVVDDVNEETATDLIRRGWAEPLEATPPAPVKAVPKSKTKTTTK